MSELGPLPEQKVFNPRIPLGDLRDAIRMDHRLPPLRESKPGPPPTRRHYVRPDPFETPVLNGGRAANLIPVVLVVPAWQINAHAGIALAFLVYGALIAKRLLQH